MGVLKYWFVGELACNHFPDVLRGRVASDQRPQETGGKWLQASPKFNMLGRSSSDLKRGKAVENFETYSARHMSRTCSEHG